MLAVMQCSAGPPPEQKRGRKIPHQILVRGCAYSPDGDYVFTCASGRRGKAFLGKWKRVKPDPTKKLPAFLPVENCCVAECPVSAMSMSGDGTMVALGSVEGKISFIGLEGMNLLRTYPVHDLPVTCIAARPTPLNWAPLKNMKNLAIDAVSASADNKLALISTQSHRMTWSGLFQRLFWLVVIGAVGKYCYDECEIEMKSGDFELIKQCLCGPPPNFVTAFPPH